MPRHKRKVRHQRPRHGFPRQPLQPYVTREIVSAIRHTSHRFNCSASFVIAVALADYFGIPLDRTERY